MACALLLNDDHDDYDFFQGDKLDKKSMYEKGGRKKWDWKPIAQLAHFHVS